jgi:chaperonin GroEL
VFVLLKRRAWYELLTCLFVFIRCSRPFFCLFACQSPCSTIVKNTGGEGAVVCEELVRRNDSKLGFDAANNKYVNMIDAGIIDPVKVVRTAFTDATRIASLMITTEAMIVELPEDKPAAGEKIFFDCF